MTTKENTFDYIGLAFENVEGIYIHARAFKCVYLSGYDRVIHLTPRDDAFQETVLHCMNDVQLIADEKAIFDPANLDFRHMHQSKDPVAACTDFKRHMDCFQDLVSITLYDSKTKAETEYYVSWGGDDDYCNLDMAVTVTDGELHLSVKKKEHEENPKQSEFVAAFLADMDTSIAGVEKSLAENLEKSLDVSVADIKDTIRDALRQV